MKFALVQKILTSILTNLNYKNVKIKFKGPVFFCLKLLRRNFILNN